METVISNAEYEAAQRAHRLLLAVKSNRELHASMTPEKIAACEVLLGTKFPDAAREAAMLTDAAALIAANAPTTNFFKSWQDLAVRLAALR